MQLLTGWLMDGSQAPEVESSQPASQHLRQPTTNTLHNNRRRVFVTRNLQSSWHSLNHPGSLTDSSAALCSSQVIPTPWSREPHSPVLRGVL